MTAETGIVYWSPDGTQLQMDIYRPRVVGGRTLPIALYIHGGAWRGGDRSISEWVAPVADLLVSKGFLLASIDYRLAPQHKWPAFIHDAKAAVRYLRKNAGRYGADPDRILAWGESAGGHIAALLGTTDPSAGLEGDGDPGISTRVQGVIDLYGPADLTTEEYTHDQEQIVREAFGATGPGDPVLVEGSPISYVTPDDPPFLIIQGDQDTLVPAYQSKRLHERLLKAGVSTRLVMVRNAEHGLASTGDPIVPPVPEILAEVSAYLDLTFPG